MESSAASVVGSREAVAIGRGQGRHVSVGGLAEVTRVEGQRARCCVRVAWLNPGGSVSVYIDAHTDSRLSVRTSPIAMFDE